MYETIYGALVEAGLENAFAPQDFLNFFCLGNREVDEFQTSGIANQNTNTTTTTTPQVIRTMIFSYRHIVIPIKIPFVRCIPGS